MRTGFIDSAILLKNSCLKMEEDILNRFNISPSEYKGLLVIDEGEILSGKVYSARMDLSISRGSRIIEHLVKNGYLKHEDCSDDRRCNKVSLTAKGIKLRKEIYKLLDECEEELLSVIPENELVSLKSIINKFTNILNSK
ncbi:MAG: MarR family transcriptional regulator [Ignavibacteriae bacterium]|nr:MAG: MarR family transcriptional regulator [Ignavibacteriota bacterium]